MSDPVEVRPADPFGLPKPSQDLRTVLLLRYPLRLWVRAQEHYDGLMREFTLLAIGQQAGQVHHVPARLLDLVARLTAQYANASAAPDAVREAAVERGDRSVDLTYRTPVEARAATRALQAMLAEADEYCRAGDELLTLAAPADIAAFTDWYLEEFLHQLDGGAPRPWPGSLD